MASVHSKSTSSTHNEAETINPSYLVRQNSSLCFRIRIPSDLQEIIGRNELRYSLRTGSIGEAKYLARRTAGQVQWIFRRLRKEKQMILKGSSDHRTHQYQCYGCQTGSGTVTYCHLAVQALHHVY